MSLILPNRFKSQPQYPAPLAGGPLRDRARFVLLGNQSSEILNGINRSGTIGTTEVTTDGIAYLPTTANTVWTKQVLDLDPYVAGSFSVNWYGILRADTFQNLLNYTGPYGWEFRTYNWGTNQIRLGLTAYWSGASPATGAIGAVDNILHSVSMVYDDAAASVEFFLDGRSAGSVGFSKDPGAIGAGSFSVKGHSTLPHKMLTVQAYKGKLTQAEILTLARNPWQIFKAPARRLWTTTAAGTVALSGQALAISQGSLGVDTSVALSGQQGSLSSGTLSTAGDAIVALSGQSLSSAQGLLLPEIDVSLTGQALASSQGGLGVSLDAGLSGQALALSQGTIGTQGDVTVALAGIGMAASQGTLSPPQAQSEGGHFAGVGVVGKRRKKRDLANHDRDEIRHHLKLQLDETYAALFQPEIPAEIQEQAAAVIKQLQQPDGRNDNIPALQQEVFHIRQMLTLWEQQARQQAEYQRSQRQAEEDEELLMMFL